MDYCKGITVYCASSDSIPEVYFEAARDLGAAIARSGLPVINGGGHVGLMGAVNDAALAAGGHAVGVIPQFMVDRGLCHPALSDTVVTPDMATRKRLLAQMALGVVALPGGVGTLEELFETMTNRKLGFFNAPIVILNVNHYYDPLLKLLKTAEDEGFSYGPRQWTAADTVNETMQFLISKIHGQRCDTD